MRKKLLSVNGLIILVLFVMLAGCSSTKSSESASGDAEKKDELILALGSEPEAGFDPTTGWGRYGSPLFQSTLFKRGDQLNIVNDLAISYEVSEDGRVWNVKLRDDVKFSDGEPLTATDVKFTFDTAAVNGSVVDLNVLEKIEALDDTTVRFTLKEVQSSFINTLTATGIVPEHAYGEDYAEKPIGSGPYQLVQWDKGQQLIVRVNPEYYNKMPYFKKLTFLYLNEDAAFSAAQAGTVDLTYIPSTFSHQKVSGMKLEAVETVDNRGIAYPFIKSGGFTEDGLPIGNDVTANLAIRQAIDIAIDREALVDGVIEGYGSPAYTSVDGLPWWNPETVIEDSDVEGANKLLKDAGWEDTDGDGILEKDSLKAEFSLYYPAGDTIRQSLAITVADMIKPIGINIKVEGASWDVIGGKMHSEAILMGWGSHNPFEMYNIYASENGGVEYNNTGFYSNGTVDGYFKQAIRAKSEDSLGRHSISWPCCARRNI